MKHKAFLLFILISLVVVGIQLFSSGEAKEVDLIKKTASRDRHRIESEKNSTSRDFKNRLRIEKLSLKVEELEKTIQEKETKTEAKKKEDSEFKLTPEERVAEEERKMAEADAFEVHMHEGFEETFRKDSYDEVWDNEMRRKMDTVLNEDALSYTADYKLNCKSIVCKLEVTHESSDNQESFLEMTVEGIMSDSEKIDGFWYRKNETEDGKRATYIYVFKKGTMAEVESSIAKTFSMGNR